jgi:hypothetical protein
VARLDAEYGERARVSLTFEENVMFRRIASGIIVAVLGELEATGPSITVGVPDANGVAIHSPRDSDRRR